MKKKERYVKQPLAVKFLESDEWLNFQDLPKLTRNDFKNTFHLSFKIDVKYVKAIDSEVKRGKYLNRSEFLRDMVRNYFLKGKTDGETK